MPNCCCCCSLHTICILSRKTRRWNFLQNSNSLVRRVVCSCTKRTHAHACHEKEDRTKGINNKVPNCLRLLRPRRNSEIMAFSPASSSSSLARQQFGLGSAVRCLFLLLVPTSFSTIFDSLAVGHYYYPGVAGSSSTENGPLIKGVTLPGQVIIGKNDQQTM